MIYSSIYTGGYIYYNFIYMKYSNIGLKIREKRNKQGLTQQQLADSIGVTWEMVSRYERGDSSPLNRMEALAKALDTSPLELLQEYYESSDSVMLDSMINNIPLFTQVPTTLLFAKENTTNFYNAPIWVTQRDKEAFAVEYSAITSRTPRITEGSIVYISPNSKPVEDSIVLFKENGSLICDLFSKVKRSESVVGVIIAKEVRF